LQAVIDGSGRLKIAAIDSLKSVRMRAQFFAAYVRWQNRFSQRLPCPALVGYRPGQPLPYH
jgi:hypothetical protein